MTRQVQFDIALSFAGEDRVYVDQVANLLNSSGVKVFYDVFEGANLWGKNLYDYLSEVYQHKAQYTIMFISEHYARKLWTSHERQAMQARAFQENQEYVLPVRFDDTPIPGLLPTIGYIALKGRTPQEFVKLVHAKLVHSGRTVPSELIRASVYSVTAPSRTDPTEATATIFDDAGVPIDGATLVAIADNDTYKEAVTQSQAPARFSFHTRRKYRLLVAHPERPAAQIPEWDPASDLRVTLPSSENTGSVVFHSTGYIPGLQGRLNPVLDARSKCYLYADNIAIRGGEQQPAVFEVGVPFQVEDSNGTVMHVRIVHIQGRTSLIEFVRTRQTELELKISTSRRKIESFAAAMRNTQIAISDLAPGNSEDRERLQAKMSSLRELLSLAQTELSHAKSSLLSPRDTGGTSEATASDA